jgi:hypothetical protein
MKLQVVKTQEAIIWIVPAIKVWKPVLYLLLQCTCPKQQQIIGTLSASGHKHKTSWDIFHRISHRFYRSAQYLKLPVYLSFHLIIKPLVFSFEVVLCWSTELDIVRCKICSEWRMVKMLPAVWGTHVFVAGFWGYSPAGPQDAWRNTNKIWSDEVISEVYWLLLTLVLNTFRAGHAYLVYHIHKSLNCSADCMEKNRWRYLVLLKIHVYVINRTVMYCLCTEHNK